MIDWIKKKCGNFIIQRFLLPLMLLLLFIIGLALLIVSSFRLSGIAQVFVLILGGLLIFFAVIKLTINSIIRGALEREEGRKWKAKFKKSEEGREEIEVEFKQSKTEPLQTRKIQSILNIGLLEVNFKLTKFYDRWFLEKDGELKETVPEKAKEGTVFRFMGGLSVEFPARYGIDMKAIKLRDDQKNKRIYVAGANLSFQGLSGVHDLEWEGTVFLNRTLFGGWKYDSQDATYIGKELKCKNKYKKQFLEKLKQGPEELNYLRKPFQEHIRQLLQSILAPPGYTVELVSDEIGEDFMLITDYINSNHYREIEQEQ